MADSFEQSVGFADDVSSCNKRMVSSHVDQEDVTFATGAFRVALLGNEELLASPKDGIARYSFDAADVVASVAKDHQIAFLQCVARQTVDQYTVATVQERLKTIVGNGEDGGYKSSYQKHQRQQTKTIDNEQEPLAQHRCAACRFFFHGLVVHCQLLIVQGLRSCSVEAI